jgi:hypothetical protein
VLKVISSSPGKLEPVFQTMLENAVRICNAKFGTFFRFDGELAERVASVGTPAALIEFQRQQGTSQARSAARIFGQSLSERLGPTFHHRKPRRRRPQTPPPSLRVREPSNVKLTRKNWA